VPTTPSSTPTTAPPPSSTPAPFRFLSVADIEPNNETSSATVAYFPMRAAPEQLAFLSPERSTTRWT
jgi:hypothetical protein